MNILPKKSWHVRNKDNVAKVRKDEENARKQAIEQGQRAAAAQQEATIGLLRNKARSRVIENSADLLNSLKADLGQLTPSSSNGRNVMDPPSGKKNEEHENEKKKEILDYEKKIGVLKYLGQGAVETMEESDKPWYFRPPKRKSSHDAELYEDVDEKESKRKSSLDPLNMMKAHVQKKRHSDKTKLKKAKKHNRKKKHGEEDNDKERKIVEKSAKLAKLRKERLEREKQEKQRTSELLYGEQKRAVNSFPGKYNSQYNPHLAKSRGTL